MSNILFVSIDLFRVWIRKSSCAAAQGAGPEPHGIVGTERSFFSFGRREICESREGNRCTRLRVFQCPEPRRQTLPQGVDGDSTEIRGLGVELTQRARIRDAAPTEFFRCT